MAPKPVVTGLSPKEGPPGTKITIRGEHLGSSARDLIGKRILHMTVTEVMTVTERSISLFIFVS